MFSFTEESRDAALGWISRNRIDLPGFVTDEWLMETLAFNYPGGIEGFISDWKAGQKS